MRSFLINLLLLVFCCSQALADEASDLKRKLRSKGLLTAAVYVYPCLGSASEACIAVVDPVSSTAISIIDNKGKIIYSGQTDEFGRLNVFLSKRKNYRLRIDGRPELTLVNPEFSIKKKKIHSIIFSAALPAELIKDPEPTTKLPFPEVSPGQPLVPAVVTLQGKVEIVNCFGTDVATSTPLSNVDFVISRINSFGQEVAYVSGRTDAGGSFSVELPAGSTYSFEADVVLAAIFTLVNRVFSLPSEGGLIQNRFLYRDLNCH